jgi:ABC-type branched-subunit amino acid transport system ATPase component
VRNDLTPLHGMDGEPLLRVDRVSHEFAGLRALSAVSLNVRRGEIVGLIGPNGSGKTTLFNLITGIYPVRQGQILLEGRDLTGATGHEIAAAGIMRTFQNPRVFASLGLAEHAVIPMRVVSHPVSFMDFFRQLGTSWRAHSSAAEDILRQLALDSTNGALAAGALPYGRRRVLEIARCLAGSPKLLLLDEPTAGLNSDEMHEVHGLLERLGASLGLTMIVIDHDIEFIERLCSRLVVLSNGQILCEGPCDEVLRAPQVAAAYFGRVEPCS